MTTRLPDLLDLTGRTAFITGSTRGLGWSTAQCLAGLGARVAINGRSSDAVDARCREIEQAGGQA
ncbi:MAG: SDR family NAD(P)-dependent oxidoreductase, partial [Rhodospirillaceae bacterium]|nr:SDR family NAD(P)-dependent oxidoreductase [Rhodospirillaceae bacterium]